MITAIHRARAAEKKHGEQGFTLIELLVVVLIIGILAAIAIPVFLGQQASAKDAGMESDVANLKEAEVSYATDHDGTLTDDTSLLTSYGFKSSPTDIDPPGVMLAAESGNFCVSGKSGSGTWFAATQDLGVAPGYCGADAVFRNYQPSFA